MRMNEKKENGPIAKDVILPAISVITLSIP